MKRTPAASPRLAPTRLAAAPSAPRFGAASLWALTLLALTLPALLGPESLLRGAEPPPEAAPPLDGREGRQLLLENFRPVPSLKVASQAPRQAKFPAIDLHTHFGLRFRTRAELDAFVQVMDRQQIAVCVSLDGQLGEALDEHARYLWDRYPDRFALFANIDWRGAGRPDDPATWDCQRPDFARRMAGLLAAAKARGACGLKVFKSLGLEYRNPDGSLIKVDDPRWDPIWKACGELGFPVLIHTADPSAFFRPIDAQNERWEELHRRPEWSFPADKFPPRDELLAARLRVVARHRQTIFVAAHLGNDGEDLAQTAAWLDAHPNLYVDFASRIAELGRQPYTARKFLLKYADRVLFATDGPWPETRIGLYWRFLETWDENFPYSEKPFPPQGFWNIYGVALPDEVLRKIYFENALRLLPALREKYARAAAALARP